MNCDRISWNRDWLFSEQYCEDMMKQEYDDGAFEVVSIPHTCKEVPLHYFDETIYQMECVYRKHFVPESSWDKKRIILNFQGVGHGCEVFCNGEKVGEHHCGYTGFRVELTKHVIPGQENVIALRVDSRENQNIPPFGYVVDYMTFGGIYREVYLEVLDELILEDVFFYPGFEQHKVKEVSFELTFDKEMPGYSIGLDIRKKGEDKGFPLTEKPVNGKAMTLSFATADILLLAKENNLPGFTMENWSPENPVLYEVCILLKKGEEICQRELLSIGFRDSEFRKEGFFLNGKRYQLRGLNRHQSYPYVGYAMPASMQRLDARILREELGVNAVRTSHYPQSQAFLDACDELGLLVFTEMPGWQHIGDEAWKEQALVNEKEMILQNRNHASIILWGVRINESVDDDAFYERTNALAHMLDPTRQTGGVRAIAGSHLLEDVYTYNDFVHEGNNPGVMPKKKITSNVDKPYLVSEYNGHMFPTKAFDCEDRRVEHALRHAKVLNDVVARKEIAGCFGWCMFDYNTHKDFGSGDRVCYHGVMDMFRNPKLAASVYASQQEEKPYLEVGSSMDIGEHPGCNRGLVYLFTNADSVRMYKNERFIKEFTRESSPYRELPHGPLVVDDFVGDVLTTLEHMKPGQAKGTKKLLNTVAREGLNHLPLRAKLRAAWLILRYHMNFDQATRLYNLYVGDWGGASTSYTFQAVKNGEVVKTIVREPMHETKLQVSVSHTTLVESDTYDVAAIRLRMLDENGGLLSFYQEPVSFITEGPIKLIGPETVTLQGGMGGCYVKTTGERGKATLTVLTADGEPHVVELNVEKRQ